jgi:adenylate kinase family enzyme
MNSTDTIPPPHGPVFIGIIGPPASGKSTLAARLAETLAAPVLRPRDAIRAALAHEPELHELFVPINELGWVSDGALGLAVRAAVARVPESCRAVVLENLPGDAFQVADIHLAVRQRGARFIVVHLDGSDDVLFARGTSRRVCQACESDSSYDPHEPAITQLGDGNRCGRCGGVLSIRRDDEDTILRDRTVRHRHYARGVLRMIHALGIPLVGVDIAADPASIERRVLEAVELLAQPAHAG